MGVRQYNFVTTMATGVLVVLIGTGPAAPACAQEPSPEDQVIDSIRQRADIGASDQRRIGRWVQMQVDEFAGAAAFRGKFGDQYNHDGNSDVFKRYLTVKTTEIAAQLFPNAAADDPVVRALAQVLIDWNRLEAFDALVAGLTTADAPARLLCARGLAVQRRFIANDDARVAQMIQALNDAGLAETQPVILRRIYEALALPGKTAEVFDVYLRIFDKRLAARRGTAVIADGAEVFAYAYFLDTTVQRSLDADQKNRLVLAVAAFLRLDAQRYDSPNVPFGERDWLERSLDAGERILEAVVGSSGGRIRDKLSEGGYSSRAEVRKEAYRWVGDPLAKAPGSLNQAPWNVPIGAP